MQDRFPLDQSLPTGRGRQSGMMRNRLLREMGSSGRPRRPCSMRDWGSSCAMSQIVKLTVLSLHLSVLLRTERTVAYLFLTVRTVVKNNLLDGAYHLHIISNRAANAAGYYTRYSCRHVQYWMMESIVMPNAITTPLESSRYTLCSIVSFQGVIVYFKRIFTIHHVNSAGL